MRRHAMDAWVRAASVLNDEDLLKAVLDAAALAGGATVVGEEFYAFPNGAVTGGACRRSHLSNHNWPELALANIDLLTCGDIDGDIVLSTIRERLDVERASIRCILRSLG